ncbi:FMN-dependent NADH-azoreductase [Fulvivirga sediminis]|uniref:FMN dependent NADH:quinone oxidoreductase n=1 Tax=Fulvivirga sediminis TaxID=2803949 RepID=A0A937F6M8_9BACT|nr:FMN-dependent NADH-azoreductase [Fulvivirga sediminis]MBL3656720.1 FMN-dependent NADH-azoreductase [Fulvivirga sediminis]
MSKVLRIKSSFRGEEAFSAKLGDAIVAKLKEKDAEHSVIERDVANSDFPHIDGEIVGAMFTPQPDRTAEQQESAKLSDDAIEEVMDADIIVIDAPLYNFGIPSNLKAWIDHIAKAGVTFRYTETGPEGLVKGKKVYVAMASGGVYSEGDFAALDFVTPYLKTILGFLGMDDVTVFRVEGTAVPELKETALENGINSVEV